MQLEIDASGPSLPVQILGVNQIGAEIGNPYVIPDRDLPWLQDVAQVDAFSLWQVAPRDVVILDPDNAVFAIYNLNDYDLGDPHHYAELKTLLLAAANDPCLQL